jgi:integrase
MAKAARAVPRVKVISRHRADCPSKTDGKAYVRCACPKALYWYEGGKERVVSADTDDYQEAERRAFKKQSEFEAVATGEPEHTTVKDAVDLYLKSKTTSGYTQKSLDRLALIFRDRMETFLAQKGIVYLKDIKRADLEQWRATWTGAANTKGKYQGRVKGFFDWAVNSELIDKSPALGLERIKGARDVAPTLALSDEQFQTVLDSIDKLTHRADEDVTRFRAVVLLQRWSGLAIKDAITVERTRFKQAANGWYRLFLRRAKTGVDVYASLAPDVAAQILAVKPVSERYLFWDGKKPLEQMTNWYGCAYRRVSELAALKDEHGNPLQVHSHMMRDSFAVWCFTQGMATEDVAALLGHKNILVTQQHYSPWIRIRQERLGSIVESAYHAWTAKHTTPALFLVGQPHTETTSITIN